MKILWGMKDWCFDPLFLREWRERFPKAEVDEHPDAGHYILEDAHTRIAPAVHAFLRHTDP